MPATVQIRRYCGDNPFGPPDRGVDITGINTRANTTDSHYTSDVSYPIQIPTTGTNYSFWVTVGLYCVSPPSGVINNLRFFTDGTNNFGTGVTCKVGRTNGSLAMRGYVKATGTERVSGTPLVAGSQLNHTGLRSFSPGVYTENAFNFTSTTPMMLEGSIGATTGGFGDLVVYQIEVGPTALPGATGSETFTFRYDET